MTFDFINRTYIGSHHHWNSLPENGKIQVDIVFKRLLDQVEEKLTELPRHQPQPCL